MTSAGSNMLSGSMSLYSFILKRLMSKWSGLPLVNVDFIVFRSCWRFLSRINSKMASELVTSVHTVQFDGIWTLGSVGYGISNRMVDPLCMSLTAVRT